MFMLLVVLKQEKHVTLSVAECVGCTDQEYTNRLLLEGKSVRMMSGFPAAYSINASCNSLQTRLTPL